VQRIKEPLRPDRVRTITKNFSWIDRELLHRDILENLGQAEILLYFLGLPEDREDPEAFGSGAHRCLAWSHSKGPHRFSLPHVSSALPSLEKKRDGALFVTIRQVPIQDILLDLSGERG
jgi:hypothetical protein